MVNFIRTKEGISLFLNHEIHEVQENDPRYVDIVAAIQAGGDNVSEVIEEILSRDLRKVQTALVGVTGGVELNHGVVTYNGQPLHNSLTDRLLRMVDEGFDAKPLLCFLERLMKNPSYRVVQNLYDFLEVGGIPITPDGYFLTYKAIKDDWKDIYSGTIDNSVGKVVEVPRNQVDEDSERTCSHGLHVCSYAYLPHFAHANGRVVVCKVDPADVVAIPADYNNTKMRTCKYEVVDEYKDYYTEERKDALRRASVVSSYSPSSFYDGEGYEDEDSYDEEDEDDYVY